MRITITHFLKALGIALVFILAGILSHLPWQNEFLQTFCKLTGNVLMLALLIEWLVRIYSGVIQKAIRKYLLATALLTIYWYVIKIIKWYFVDNETVSRYFWYSYYVAIVLFPLFVPLVLLWSKHSRSNPDDRGGTPPTTEWSACSLPAF